MTNSITRREEREDLIARAPSAVRDGLEARKLANAVAAEIAKLSWGGNLSQQTARAIADWGREHDVDVLTELDILGGRLYRNSQFWIRKLSELVAAGRVSSVELDHVNEDKRLDTWPEERERRLRERIKHQIPDNAAGACLCRISVVGMDRPIIGVEWCGGPDGGKDPVGSAEPAKTSETRSIRRAVRLVSAHVPELRRQMEALEYAAVEIESAVAEDAASIEPPRRMIPVPQPQDPYAPEPGDAAEGDDAAD